MPNGHGRNDDPLLLHVRANVAGQDVNHNQMGEGLENPANLLVDNLQALPQPIPQALPQPIPQALPHPNP